MNSHLLRRLVMRRSDAPEHEPDEQELSQIAWMQETHADRRVQLLDTLRQAEVEHAAHQAQPRQKSEAVRNRDMSWHDHLFMLLQVAAGVEHALMVQYLYAAYSIGGTEVPRPHRKKVSQWRDSILAAAKEEMGHLLTVQNILAFAGGPVNLERDDFPWDAKYYPFPFTLEPFTLQSLSCYVYAEMPKVDEIKKLLKKKKIPRYVRFVTRDWDEIEDRVLTITDRPRPVGILYDQILETIKDPSKIPDSYLQPETFTFQASSDEWGRGYEIDPGPSATVEGIVAGGSTRPPRKRIRFELDAHVKIARVATRAQAIEALEEISMQGEGPHMGSDNAPSHFDRFLKIYQQYKNIGGSWSPSWNVPRDPTTLPDVEAGNRGTYIVSKTSRTWASLFNLRYRLLLTYLAHTFRLARVTRSDEPNVRAMVMHRVFGEMYNLKTLARILVGLPFTDGIKRRATDPDYAGPPFEMPYSLRLPPTEADCWALYGEILGTSCDICNELLKTARKQDPQHVEYLETLRDLDEKTRAWIERFRAGLLPRERRF